MVSSRARSDERAVAKRDHEAMVRPVPRFLLIALLVACSSSPVASSLELAPAEPAIGEVEHCDHDGEKCTTEDGAAGLCAHVDDEERADNGRFFCAPSGDPCNRIGSGLTYPPGACACPLECPDPGDPCFARTCFESACGVEQNCR
jgi:hypothetical protein